MTDSRSYRDRPTYRDRFPCRGCGTGYLDCAALHNISHKCCVNCDGHPGCHAAAAYSQAEIDDMWGRSGRGRPRPRLVPPLVEPSYE